MSAKQEQNQPEVVIKGVPMAVVSVLVTHAVVWVSVEPAQIHRRRIRDSVRLAAERSVSQEADQ